MRVGDDNSLRQLRRTRALKRWRQPFRPLRDRFFRKNGKSCGGPPDDVSAVRAHIYTAGDLASAASQASFMRVEKVLTSAASLMGAGRGKSTLYRCQPT